MPIGGMVDRSETRDVFESQSRSLLLQIERIIASRREGAQFRAGCGMSPAERGGKLPLTAHQTQPYDSTCCPSRIKSVVRAVTEIELMTLR
jgi:hypothetical protein